MRIIHTCLRYPPATGGVETYVREIVERTRDVEAGKDVRVLTSKLRTHGPLSELDPSLLLDDPMHVQRLHHLGTPCVSYPRLQALKYYIHHHKPDIIHAYSFWYQPADVAARYAREKHIPFFFHPMFYENDVRKKLLWQLYKRTIGKRTFDAADVVIVISPFERSLIEQAGFGVKRFVLIPPGIETEQFASDVPNPFAKRGIRGNIILSVGRIARGKGLEDSLEALVKVQKEVRNVAYVIIGEDFGHKDALERRVRKLGLRSSVYFLGACSRRELIGAYKHADILVHPSYYEAFGIVLAESLAAGTPVIARRTSAVPYVVPDGKAGILFSSQDELTHSIIKLLKNDKKRGELASVGRQHVLDNFHWDASIKKLADLYKEYGQ